MMRKQRRPEQTPYEELLSALGLQVLLVDASGRIAYANPRAESVLAAQPGSLQSLIFDSLLSLRNPQWIAHEIRKRAAEGHWSGEVVLNKLDDTECWAHVQACKCPEAFGLRDCVLLEFEDITGNIEFVTTLMKRSEDLYRRNRELEVVGKVGRLLLADTGLERRLSAVLREAAKVVGASVGVAWVRSRDGRDLVVRGAYGCETEIYINRMRTGVDEQSVAATTVRTGRAQIVEDMTGEPSVLRPLVQKTGVKSALSVPMIASGEVTGTLMLGETGARRTFSAEDVTLFEVMANSAASAVANAVLAEDMDASRASWQRTFDAIGDMIVVVDDHGKVLQANASVASQLGVSSRELLGEECERLVPGTHEELLRQVIDSGARTALNNVAIGGELCEVTAFPLAQAMGEPDAVVICAKVIRSSQHREAA